MGDTLRVGEELGLGQSLTGGAYTLTLQPDGNLVLSELGGNVVWATQTHDQGVDKAVLQHDGNFVLYKGADAAWSTETNGKSADRLVVQADRNVVLYGTDGAALWASGTNTDNPLPAPEQQAEQAPAAAPVEDVPPPPPAPQPRTYTVEPGDTLWAIAERFYGDGNRYQEIADASGIPNPDAINPGQVLTIP
ncbi:LysM peptidoglycan-binding domain-containing protein [Nocardia farcinica]|uniref:LysM peptidoglycan-binding domain-containing protein n=1 Tax=Nocardia farcinica TaxID=37329 RepID=UPI001895352D|nr:LysM peptidoglycan-binding domain-containing protein [Nocardia farcinica]MBF6386096.1 LysM peptidoglycan-binding domain-containing protein [Nocardia farcinica]MBF6538722.1 LysM peptidoglycan-binding domain-containing protein [Nocardia farcinica]MCZ9329762.1 LysM peptidoglycan-binding domain-containing protein [Nocardia farcinica]